MRKLLKKMLMLNAFLGLVLVFSNVDVNAQDIYERQQQPVLKAKAKVMSPTQKTTPRISEEELAKQIAEKAELKALKAEKAKLEAEASLEKKTVNGPASKTASSTSSCSNAQTATKVKGMSVTKGLTTIPTVAPKTTLSATDHKKSVLRDLESKIEEISSHNPTDAKLDKMRQQAADLRSELK